jgi:hypothetical protein
MVIQNEFAIGQIVYQLINTDHTALHIVGINIKPNNVLIYICTTPDAKELYFYDFELTLDRDACLIH